ncbi:uncharacterized protein LOC100376919 [Saccoglossus kowalevskii]|uniref:Uncharacterized protein LOC100376919 n=1 Tax=Saccoglossus kowalevskii TaxID=10224 RepID=A0ABM0M3A9_SACKO|nr:PREDICTED: uncharacterized protein LOC100376919 [Saccoglossus kowalevskii]
MKLQVAIGLVIFAVITHHTVESLDCLQCVGVGYNDCGGRWGREDEMGAMPCPPEFEWCFVAREDREEGRYTHVAYERGCSLVSRGNYCDLGEENGEALNTCYSSCQQDGCNRDNGSTTLQISAFAAFLTIFVFAIFVF